MFVKLGLDYQWYGNQVDTAFVGPFKDVESASIWAFDFRQLMVVKKAHAAVTPVTDLTMRATTYSAEKTPEQVYTEMYSAMMEYCSG